MVKKTLKKTFIALLRFQPLALLLRRPTQWLMVKLAFAHGKLGAVYRNLPQAHKIGLIQNENKTRFVSRYYLDLGDRCKDFPYQPKISVIVPVYKIKDTYLRDALRSVAQQVYTNWEICAVDDRSEDPAVQAVLEAFRAEFPDRVRIATNAKNMHISATSNECLKLATGDYVALLDHDDRFYPNALAEVVRYINLHKQPDILYSDECTIDAVGNRTSPIFYKPDWSPFMHMTMNYTTHLTVYRRDLVNQVGGFRLGYEGSQDHDLMLRMVAASAKPVVHIPFCLYQWRAHEASTALSQDSKPYAGLAGEKALADHLWRLGRPGTVKFNKKTLLYRIKFDLPKPAPLVSIVIPSRDSPQLIRQCIDSVVRLSTYKNWEIIISDNGSTNQETLAYYEQLQRDLGDRFRLLLRPRPFNFGAQVNDGVRAAKGEYVVLLNNDTEVIEPSWMEEMLGIAQFPEVGAVGAKLLLKNRHIQHGGIVLSTINIAEHLGFLLEDEHTLYWNTLNTMHETSAVTAACLMIAVSKYWEVGGLDAVYLPRGYGDIEFCLSLRDKGYINVYNPNACLYHDESVSRGREIEYFERFYLLHHRGGALAADPYLNDNFDRNPWYSPNPFYLALDLDKREFDFFLTTPMAQWKEKSAKLRY